MRICLISVEIFAWGKYGGFGRATRVIGSELAKRGVEVVAVVPRREGQKREENLDGIKVLSFPPVNFFEAQQLFITADADIYHSQEPSLGTYLAQRAMPSRKHIVTFRDTRNIQDWRIELHFPSLSPAQVIANWLYEDNLLVKHAVQKANAHFAAAQLLIPKARLKYRLNRYPSFLPTPVRVPPEIIKSNSPTVCFISRWDKRKRPELFFEVVKKFPHVHFIAAGKSRDIRWDDYLRDTYGHLPNLEMLGFIDQFRSDQISQILEKSWVLINTAAREGLPNVFLEAAAHGCALLSSVDPDGFASRFGYYAEAGDFAAGLEYLLDNLHWQKHGNQARQFMIDVFQVDKSIGIHLDIYNRLLDTNINSYDPHPQISSS